MKRIDVLNEIKTPAGWKLQLRARIAELEAQPEMTEEKRSSGRRPGRRLITGAVAAALVLALGVGGYAVARRTLKETAINSGTLLGNFRSNEEVTRIPVCADPESPEYNAQKEWYAVDGVLEAALEEPGEYQSAYGYYLGLTSEERERTFEQILEKYGLRAVKWGLTAELAGMTEQMEALNVCSAEAYTFDGLPSIVFDDGTVSMTFFGRDDGMLELVRCKKGTLPPDRVFGTFAYLMTEPINGQTVEKDYFADGINVRMIWQQDSAIHLFAEFDDAYFHAEISYSYSGTMDEMEAFIDSTAQTAVENINWKVLASLDTDALVAAAELSLNDGTVAQAVEDKQQEAAQRAEQEALSQAQEKPALPADTAHDETYIDYDFELGSVSNSGYGHPVAESDDAYYLIASEFVYRIDKATGEQTVLCNKPGCAHDHESMFPDNQCNAAVWFHNVTYYDGSIYVTCLHHGGLRIKRLSPEGELLETIDLYSPDVPVYVFHDGYIYFAGKEMYSNKELLDDQKPRLTEEGNMFFARYDLQTRETELLAEWEIDYPKNHGCPISLYAVGRYVYYTETTETSTVEDTRYRVAIYDTQTGEITYLEEFELEKDREMPISDGERLYFTKGGTVYSTALDGTDRQEVGTAQFDGGLVSVKDGVIVESNYRQFRVTGGDTNGDAPILVNVWKDGKLACSFDMADLLGHQVALRNVNSVNVQSGRLIIHLSTNVFTGEYVTVVLALDCAELAEGIIQAPFDLA